MIRERNDTGWLDEWGNDVPDPQADVMQAIERTDADHRHLVYAIADDDWHIVAVACDLPHRVPPEWRGATWPPGNGDAGAVVR